LDEFQKVDIDLKMEKISRQMVLAKRQAKVFTSETARDTTNKQWNPDLTEGHGARMPFLSPDAKGIESEIC
jgi:hypothetical protein